MIMRRLAMSALAVGSLATPKLATAQDAPPWTVAITASRRLAIGECSVVSIDLRDSTGKDTPRRPDGQRVSMVDFDMAADGPVKGALAGRYNGASSFSVCACQTAPAGTIGSVTATYPAGKLAEKVRVPGVAFVSSSPIEVTENRNKSKAEPAGCEQSTTTVSSSTTTSTPTAVLMPTPIATATPGTSAPSLAQGRVSRLAPSATTTTVPVGATHLRPDSAPPWVKGQATYLQLGGATFSVYLIEGGSIEADVVVINSTTGGTPAKHLGSVRYQPIVIGVEPGGPLDPWINEMWSGVTSKKSGSLYNGPIAAGAELAFTNAALIAVTIPALDGAAKDGGTIHVTLAPEETRMSPHPAGTSGTIGPVAYSGPGSSGPGRVWLPSNFRFAMAGVDATTMSRIESFGVQRRLTSNAGGAPASPGPLEISNLVVTISEAHGAGWLAWYDDFVLKGNNGTTAEKTFTLDLLKTNLTSSYAQIKGTGVGIVSIKSIAREGDGVRRLQIVLYVQKLEMIAVAP
ncbi:MAG: hypothetical protein M3081_12955 [Gemmatimonadota bacterium]|nr:hypothetical protein [Gemmatimonadota bacterium]